MRDYNWVYITLKDLLTYKEMLIKGKELTCLEKRELESCIQSLKAGGYENVIEALGF